MDDNNLSLSSYQAGSNVSEGAVAAYIQETKTGQMMLQKAERNAVEMTLLNMVMQHEQRLGGDLRENGRYVYLQSLLSGEGMLSSLTGRVADRMRVYIERDSIEHMQELQDTNRRAHQERLAVALKSVLPRVEPSVVERIATRLNGRWS